MLQLRFIITPIIPIPQRLPLPISIPRAAAGRDGRRVFDPQSIRQRFIGDGGPLVESFVGSRVIVWPHGPGLDHIGLQIHIIVSRILCPVEGPVPLDA